MSDFRDVEHRRAYFREYKKTQKYKESSARSRLKVKLAVFDKYGGVCQHCGFSDARALCIDHVHRGGEDERRKLTGGKLYRKLNKLPVQDGYQLLCANCNLIKAIENNELGAGVKTWDYRYTRGRAQ